MLREVHGRSYAEIADALGISEDAVAQIISRARARLRTEYRREASPAAYSAPGCAQLQDALSAYVDGRLHGLARDELEQHLGRCEACREVLAGYREAGLRLRAGVPLSPLAAIAERLSLAFHGAANQAATGLAAVVGGAAIVAAGAGGLVVAHGVAPTAAPAHAAPASTPTTTTAGGARVPVGVARPAPGRRSGPDPPASGLPPPGRACPVRVAGAPRRARPPAAARRRRALLLPAVARPAPAATCRRHRICRPPSRRYRRRW